MSDTHSQARIAGQLEQALGSGEVRADVWRRGRELLNQLQSPVRIVVMGPRHSGKSTLINMLAGAPVIPPMPQGGPLVEMPVLEITGGEDCTVACERADGEIVRLPGRFGEIEVPPGTVRATQELPRADLGRRMFTEVNPGCSPARRGAITEWAVEHADIVLWCTTAFGADERLVWANVPDALKDHSYLVLTMADRQLMKGVLEDRIASLQDIVEEEFLGLFPVATIQAIAAQSGELDDRRASLWASSGGKALSEAVARLVDNGRMADRDNAGMFLKRHSPAYLSGPETTPEQATRPPLEAPRQVSVSESPRTGTEQVAQMATGVCGDVLRLLQTRAQAMLGSLAHDGDVDSEAVLAACVETANDLCDILRDADPSDPETGELREDASESADMMLLFQYEQGEDAATDAVTLLLQLKNEISECAVS